MRQLGLGSGHGHQGKNLHELRDVFRSQWAKSPAKGEVAEFLLGHSIDPLSYNKAWRDLQFYRQEYVKALPYLQILSSGRPYHLVGEDEVKQLLHEVALIRGKRDDVELLKQRLEEVTEQMEGFRKITNTLLKMMREGKTMEEQVDSS